MGPQVINNCSAAASYGELFEHWKMSLEAKGLSLDQIKTINEKKILFALKENMTLDLSWVT